MNTTHTNNALVSFIGMVIVCLITGCGNKEPAPLPQPTPQVQQPPPAPQGRSETKTLVAAKLVGYDGSAIRQSVDKALDKNDKRQKAMEEEMK